jgi:hypothetical protein
MPHRAHRVPDLHRSCPEPPIPTVEWPGRLGTGKVVQIAGRPVPWRCDYQEMTRRFHPVWWLAAGAVLGLVGLVTYWAVGPRRALERYRAELREEGARLTLEECMPRQAPEQHQAALRFVAAAQALPRIPSSGRSILMPPPTMRMVAPGKAMAGWAQPTITDGQQSHTWEELAGWVRQAGPQLREIRESSRADAFHWNLDWSQGMMLMLPHLSPTKTTAQWLLAESAFAVREGRMDDAIEAQLTQLRVAHNLREDGLLIGQLVRIAIAAIAWNGLWELLQTEGWTDEQLARLQEAWEETEFVEAMTRSMEAERALGLCEYGRARNSPAHLRQYMDTDLMVVGGFSGASSTDGGVLDQVLGLAGQTYTKLRHGSRALLWATFESYADEQFYMESLEWMLREARHRAGAVAAAAGRPVALAAGAAFVPGLGTDAVERSERYLLASMVLPSLDRAFEKAFLMQTQRGLAQAAIALQRYRLEHGRFPESLEVLVPRFLAVVPCDWLDGAPLRYRRGDDGGFVLYSVGRDGRDDGGDPHNPNPMRTNLGPHATRDFVWPRVATPEEIAAYQERESRGR